MARLSVDTYRKQWPRIGAVLGMAVGGATALAAPRMKNTQALAAANLMALIVHQDDEEYQDPGYGPGQANRVISHVGPGLRSDNPRNYPLNPGGLYEHQHRHRVPGLHRPHPVPEEQDARHDAPCSSAWARPGLHGIVPKAVLGDWYGPGFLSAALLHVPIGAAGLGRGRRGRHRSGVSTT